MKRAWKKAAGIAAALSLALATLAVASTLAGDGRHFIYVSDKRIVTLELPQGKSKAILNYINLDDAVELVEAPALLLVDSDGKSFHGQLILNENPDDENGLYRVSDLVKPKEYRGYEILGDFRLGSAPVKAYLRLGGRIVELEALSAEDFEVEAAKIARVDLAVDPQFSLRDAGFWRGLGRLYYADSAEAQALEPKFPGNGPLPPVLLENPPPRLPQKFTSLPDPVTVRLKAAVTAQGALTQLTVLDGLQPELDEQAVETVRNSWRILPAVSNGQPAASEFTLNVTFARP